MHGIPGTFETGRILSVTAKCKLIKACSRKCRNLVGRNDTWCLVSIRLYSRGAAKTAHVILNLKGGCFVRAIITPTFLATPIFEMLREKDRLKFYTTFSSSPIARRALLPP